MKTINPNRLSPLALGAILLALVFRIPAFAAAGAAPETFVLGDFAAIFTLDAKEAGSLYRVHLGEDIFRTLRQSSKRDLAVFDAAGKPLPFIVRETTVPYDESIQEQATTHTLPLFPLPQGQTDDKTVLGDIVIRTDQGGRVVEIRGGTSAPGTDGGRFLLDLSPLRNDAKEIALYEIDFPLDTTRDVAATADVYTSPNLKDWRKIAEGEPLIRLRGEGSSIESSRIALREPQRVERYLMLAISGATPSKDTVEVTSTPRKRGVSIPDEFAAYEGLAERGTTAFLYDTGGAFPLHEALFTLASPGVYAARAEYRGSTRDEWRSLGTTTLFLTQSAEGVSKNGALPTRRETRFFRLTFPDGGPASPPALRIAWRPQEVVFMAQGDAPYLLACGSEKNAPSLQRPDLVDRVLSSMRTVPRANRANIVGRRTNEGIPAERENALTTSDWQQYMVWAVLIAGALFFSRAAWSLLRKESR